MRFLITGFPPFPGRPLNPSQRLVDAVAAGGLETEDFVATALLPVEYQRVESEILSQIEEVRPDVVLSFGVGRQAASWRLEQRARNWDEATIPDNAGELRSGVAIDEHGPVDLWNPIDLHPLARELRSSDLDVEVGHNAGSYICNHLLYWAFTAGRIDSPGSFPKFVFVHLSPDCSEPARKNDLFGLQLMINWFHNQPGRSRSTVSTIRNII